MNKKLKKELLEWVLLFTIIGGLYVTGWYRPVLATLQSAVLKTGLFRAETIEEKPANYAFTLQDVQGKRIPASSLKGQTVFINFWATWCPPCRAEMPDIHDLYEKMSDEVVFLMVSLDQDQEKAKQYMADHEYSFPLYFPNGPIPASYAIGSIPTTYVLSPDGQIVVEEHRMNQYDTKSFRALLREINQRKSTL